MQPLIATGQLADHSSDRRRRAVDLAQIPDFTLSAGIGDRHRMLVLRRINPDKRFVILLHGPHTASWSAYCFMVRPPCMRLDSVHPSNPRNSTARQGGPPASALGHNV